jgi:hypothetical protein
VKPVSERSVLDQKAYILFYIRDSASRGSTGAQQSTLLSLYLKKGKREVSMFLIGIHVESWGRNHGMLLILDK